MKKNKDLLTPSCERSVDFWQKRYAQGGGSGDGSRNKLLIFKHTFINDFIRQQNIHSVLDFGHGDLVVANELKAPDYRGIDIFDHPNPGNLNLTNCRFPNYKGSPADLVLCLDVLYHILQEEQDYMKSSLDSMMAHAKKFFIVYAQDSKNEKFNTEYRGHLYNSKWLQYMETQDEFNLLYKQQNPYPGCSAQFFIFGAKNPIQEK